MPGSDQDSASSKDSCPTDSSQDETGEDHRLFQIAQALFKQRKITPTIKGHFQGYGDTESVVEFRLPYVGEPPTSLQQLFQYAFSKIASAAPIYGSSGNAYTITMLAWEFHALTQRQWNFYPKDGYRRLLDGTIAHKVTTDFNEFQAFRAHEELLMPPARILEERGRGTVIANLTDQGKLLQYSAWLQQQIEVGILFPDEKHKIEYWMPIALQPVPDDDDPLTYVRILKDLWMERLRRISPGVAQNLALLGDDFGFRVRYAFNGLRIWFPPNPTIQAGMNRPLAEEPYSRDKWYSTSDIMEFTFPTLPDSQIKEEPTILFGPGSLLQERYDDPEVQRGKIVPIAFKQNKVQKPPNSLDRMHSTYLKQVAYNDRVIEAEKEVSSINCDVAYFLSGMSFDPNDQVVICVNGSEEMKRNEEAIGGQLWMQGDRQMSASNRVLEGMADSRESTILSAAAEGFYGSNWMTALKKANEWLSTRRNCLNWKRF
jgi:hypothetical protein